MAVVNTELELANAGDSEGTIARVSCPSKQLADLSVGDGEPWVYLIGPCKECGFLGRTTDWDGNSINSETSREGISNGSYVSAPVPYIRHVCCIIDSEIKMRDWHHQLRAPESPTHDPRNRQIIHLLTKVNDLTKARDPLHSPNFNLVQELVEAEAACISSIAEAMRAYAKKLEEHAFLPESDDWPKYTSTDPSRY